MRNNHEGGLLSGKDRFRLKEEVCLEIVLLSLSLEFSKLGKAFVDHNNFSVSDLISIRDENLTIFITVSFVELVLNPNSGTLRLANLSICIYDVANLTTWA